MFRILFLALLASPLALAQIYIDYPDGTTYTVKEHEHVFVTPADAYIKNSYQDGGVYFRRIHPNAQRDSSYVAPVGEQYQPGSHEWCLSFDTTSPYSFETATWSRVCDSNSDGVYDQADSGWNG